MHGSASLGQGVWGVCYSAMLHQSVTGTGAVLLPRLEGLEAAPLSAGPAATACSAAPTTAATSRERRTASPGGGAAGSAASRRSSSLGRVHVGLLLGLDNVLLVADALVAKPVAHLQKKKKKAAAIN